MMFSGHVGFFVRINSRAAISQDVLTRKMVIGILLNNNLTHISAISFRNMFVSSPRNSWREEKVATAIGAVLSTQASTSGASNSE